METETSLIQIWIKNKIEAQEAIDDDVVPNISTSNLARAMGVDLVMPVENQVERIEVIPSPAKGSEESSTALSRVCGAAQLLLTPSRRFSKLFMIG